MATSGKITRIEDIFNPILGPRVQVVRKDSEVRPGSKLPKPDMVDAPPHYTRLDPQPIEVIEAWNLDFFLGSAIKYIARAGFKEDAVTDLKKAVSFLQRRINRLEGGKVTK